MTKQAKAINAQLGGKQAQEAAEDINRAASHLRGLADKISAIEQMDVRQLCALYDVFCHIDDSLMAFENAPRFNGEAKYEFNAAGSFLSEFQEAFSWVSQAIIKRLKVTTPDEGGFSVYVEALLDWEARCGSDLGSITAVIADLMSHMTAMARDRKRTTSFDADDLDAAA